MLISNELEPLLKINPQTIKSAITYSLRAENILKNEWYRSAVINTAMKSLAPLDREADQWLVLWWSVVFDFWIPLLGWIWADVIRGLRYKTLAERMSASATTFNDTIDMMNSVADNFWVEQQMTVDAIDMVKKTMNRWYMSINEWYNKAVELWQEELYNEKLKWAYALSRTRELDAWKKWMIDRFSTAWWVVADDTSARVYAEWLLADMANKWRNVADMIKIENNIPWVVTFWPYRSEVLTKADFGIIQTTKFTSPWTYYKELSPIKTGVEWFSADNLDYALTKKEIDTIHDAILPSEITVSRTTAEWTKEKMFLDEVISAEWIKKWYFDEVVEWWEKKYILNNKWLEAMNSKRLGGSPSQIWVDSSATSFYDATAESKIYDWDIERMRANQVYERVEKVIDDLIIC